MGNWEQGIGFKSAQLGSKGANEGKERLLGGETAAAED
jgi:hypothetical protein